MWVWILECVFITIFKISSPSVWQGHTSKRNHLETQDTQILAPQPFLHMRSKLTASQIKFEFFTTRLTVSRNCPYNQWAQSYCMVGTNWILRTKKIKYKFVPVTPVTLLRHHPVTINSSNDLNFLPHTVYSSI